MMYFGAVKDCDIANGPGVRVSLFVSGCTNRCPGCFQPETWSFTYGKPFTQEAAGQVLSLLAPDYIDGLTLLGGDPMEPANQRALLPFLQKARTLFPRKTIWAYSGFTWEELTAPGSYPRCEVTDDILSLLDVLVDGRFVEAEKDIRLRFRGSANQRIIDLHRTRETGVLTLSSYQERSNG